MSNKMKSLLYILLDCVAMTGIIYFVKDTGKGIPIFEKIFFKNILSVIIVFFMLKRNNIPMLGARDNRLPMIGRGIVGITAVYLQFYSVTQMKLADSAVLIKTVPFFITIIAGLFLNERFRWVQFFSLILSFIGVIFVVRPGTNLLLKPSLIALLSALLAAISYSFVKYVKNNRENTLVVIFYFTGMNLAFSTVMMLGNFVVPTQHQLLDLLGLSFVLFVGQFALTNAYTYAPASEVSIYSYATILMASVLGFIAWGEIPNRYTIVGALIILTSSYITYKYDKVDFQLKKPKVA